jgi:hypothetical protein
MENQYNFGNLIGFFNYCSFPAVACLTLGYAIALLVQQYRGKKVYKNIPFQCIVYVLLLLIIYIIWRVGRYYAVNLP